MGKSKKVKSDGKAKDLDAPKSQAIAGGANRRNLVVTTSMDISSPNLPRNTDRNLREGRPMETEVS